MEDVLIVIFIAETDPDYVYQISADVQKQFQKHLGQYWCWKGIYLLSNFTCNFQFAIHTFYPGCHLCFKPFVFRLWFNWDHFSTGWFLPWLGSTEANPWWGLRMTKFTKSGNIFITGDDMERVSWRSKQALDFSFLMMYAKDRGTFYVQLEDDVLTKKVWLYV